MKRIQQFMQGRYGMDRLSQVLLFTGVILSFIGLFARSSFFSYLSYVPFVIGFIRILSRNHVKRMKENRIFLEKWNTVKGMFQKQKRNMNDKKMYKYIKCPGCHAELRVPKGKGKINVRCPKCDARFMDKT